MRVAVVYVPAGRPARLRSLAEAMAKGFEAAGHRPEVLDSSVDPARLAGFDFLAIGSEAASAGGTLPKRVAEFLGQSYGLSGKRSFAFVRKSSLRPNRLLDRLMAALEREGMRVVDSEILADEDAAVRAARGTPVERA